MSVDKLSQPFVQSSFHTIIIIGRMSNQETEEELIRNRVKTYTSPSSAL